MNRGIISVLIVAVLAAPVAEARVFRSKSMRLVLNHTDGIVEAQNLGKEVVARSSLTAAEPLEVRMAQSVNLIIGDPNPVLFKYEWVGVEFTENTNYKALSEMAKNLGTLQGLLTPGGEESGIVGRTMTMGELNDQLDKLRGYVARIPSIARQSATDVAGAKAGVNAWELDTIATAVDEFYTSLERLDANAEEGGGESIEPSETDKSKTENAASGKTGFTTDSAADVGPLTERQINRAFRQKDEVGRLITKLKDFRAAVMSINVERPMKAVEYDASKDAVATIKITPNPDFAEIAEETGRATGDLRFPIVPYYPVVATFGAAPIYSFVDAPEYSTEKQDDGTFKIVKKDTDFVGMNVSGMLTLTPRPWADSPLTGGFQLGVSPVKDQIGIFAGIELRFVDVAGIGLGYAYQQVQELADGLSVDKPLSAADELKTAPEYRGGFYLGLKLNLP